MSAIAHAHTYTCTTHICVLPKTNSRYKFRQSNILSTKFSLLILLLFWCAHYSFISFSLIHYNSQLHCSIDTFILPHIEQIIVTLYRQIFTTQRFVSHTQKKIDTKRRKYPIFICHSLSSDSIRFDSWASLIWLLMFKFFHCLLRLTDCVKYILSYSGSASNKSTRT